MGDGGCGLGRWRCLKSEDPHPVSGGRCRYRRHQLGQRRPCDPHRSKGLKLLPSLASPLDVRTRALAPLNRLCLSITAALAISSFASIASPSRVSAEIASVQDALEEEVLEQEAFEQVAVAFAMMTWLPRLEGACDLYKKGFFAESELPEAYRTLYQSYVVENPTPESAKTFRSLWSF